MLGHFECACVADSRGGGRLGAKERGCNALAVCSMSCAIADGVIEGSAGTVFVGCISCADDT